MMHHAKALVSRLSVLRMEKGAPRHCGGMVRAQDEGEFRRPALPQLTRMACVDVDEGKAGSDAVELKTRIIVASTNTNTDTMNIVAHDIVSTNTGLFDNRRLALPRPFKSPPTQGIRRLFYISSHLISTKSTATRCE